MTEYFGFFGALLIGFVLGLMGGGGSILTVPILVYILGINPVIATAYSLFIVGTTSTFGSIINYRKGLVEIKTGIKFAVPSLIAIFLTRKFIVPALPEIFFSIEGISITKNFFLMTLFAVVMMLAALSMLNEKHKSPEFVTKPNVTITIIQIFIVGIIIGFIGAGGGFLIIPSLIYLTKLPMKKAIGTSIFIIAINSLIGFTGDIGNFSPDWSFLLIFSFISILGIFVGIYISKFINEKNLKKGFGWFVLCMSILILTKEILF